MTVNLRPHRLYWREHPVSVVPGHCPEEERPIVRAVLRTDEKRGDALRKEFVVRRWEDFFKVKTLTNCKVIRSLFVSVGHKSIKWCNSPDNGNNSGSSLFPVSSPLTTFGAVVLYFLNFCFPVCTLWVHAKVYASAKSIILHDILCMTTCLSKIIRFLSAATGDKIPLTFFFFFFL